MSIITYPLLLAGKDTDGSIRNWLNREGVPALHVLRMSESWISKRLRIRQMFKKSAATAIGAGDLSVPLEDDLIAIERFTIVAPQFSRLTSKQFDDLEESWSRDEAGVISSGQPTQYTVADAIYFDRKADQSYSYEQWGWYALPPLTAAAPTNFLTTQIHTVLMMACSIWTATYDKQWAAEKEYERMAILEIDRVNSQHGMIQRGVQIDTEVP